MLQKAVALRLNRYLIFAVNNFYYDAEIIYRDGMVRNQFLEIIKENLNAKKPMVFSGLGLQGGHAFVCDGYDSNDYLHINWGWGGISDGYFDIDYMDPDDLGNRRWIRRL